MNKKLEKIDEIDSSTKDLFVAEKVTLEEISKCIEELKTSGQNGFTLQALPAWATAMQNVLIKKYTDDMLNGDGRLNKEFVEKFADLTIAEMTPAELATYNAYVEFLMSDDVTPEDMNLVIECLHSPEHEINAYELALVIDAKTRERCMKSPEPVDSFFLERSTIMVLALTTRDVSEPGKISLFEKGSLIKEGSSTEEKIKHFKYEYKKYIRPDYHTTYKESYTTTLADESSAVGEADLATTKLEHLKRKLRVDKEDYAEMLLKLGIDIGLLKARPAVGLASATVSTGIEAASSPGENEDFGVTSENICLMAEPLAVRTLIVTPGTEDGTFVYNVYATNKTENRLEFYNTVFEEYGFEPITLEEIENNPEAVNKKLRRLNSKMTGKWADDDIVSLLDRKIGPTGAYRYDKNTTCDNLDDLGKAYNLWALENGRN